MRINYITLGIGALIMASVVLFAVPRSHQLSQPVYYNAYSPLYDEFFVIASDRELEAKDIVWFDDNTQVVDYPTPYVARIISPYKSN